MLSIPKIEQRTEQPYVAIRTTISMNEISTALPPLIPEVKAWLKKNNITPGSPPFFQYLRMHDNDQFLTEVGFAVKEPVKGDDRVNAGSFPAGLYATLTYTGDYMQMKSAHSALDKWVKDNGFKEKLRINADGSKSGTRTELYITDPQQEPDPTKWVTIISYMVAE